MKKIKLSILAFCLCVCGAASADTITFDDLAGGSIPNGYDSLNWYELFVVDTSAVPISGYANGAISAKNVMAIPDFRPYSPLVTPVPPAIISAPSPFYLVSGYFTAGWLNGVVLEIVGKNGAMTEFDQTFTLNATSATFLAFPTLPVTELDFTTSGGDFQNLPYSGVGQQVAVDNLTIDFVNVPEAASTALLLVASAGGLALLRKRLA